MTAEIGNPALIARLRRGHTVLVILGAGVVGELALRFVYSRLGVDWSKYTVPPGAQDDNHTAVMVAMMVLSFLTAAACVLWCLLRVWPAAPRWHVGRLALVAIASFGVARAGWPLVGYPDDGPAEFMAAGVVAALLLGSLVIPFTLAWRWFGDRS